MSRGKIPIAEGQRISEKFDALCRHAASLAKQMADKVLDGQIAPEMKEPTNLPDEPTQWIGLSNRAVNEAVESFNKEYAEITSDKPSTVAVCNALHGIIETLCFTIKNSLPPESADESVALKQDRCTFVDSLRVADALIRKVNT